jgi:prepilin-type N-terminal cleavage/methylation domain-containing protein
VLVWREPVNCAIFYLVLPRRRRTLPRSSRGFTLVELLAVVVITAVLSLLAVAGFKRHMRSARGSEAVAVIEAIRSAQESYMAENKTYLNVSAPNNWYPQVVPSNKRSAWINRLHTDFPLWARLAPAVKETVMFGYVVNAGLSDTKIPKLQVAKGPDLSAPQAVDWYSIQAFGNVDGAGGPSLYATTSMTGELYFEGD